jgi:hypothetical protein
MIDGMAKDKVTVTIDPVVLAATDEDAAAAGQSRSEYVENALRKEHYRRLLSLVPPGPPDDPADQATMRELLAWQADAA